MLAVAVGLALGLVVVVAALAFGRGDGGGTAGGEAKPTTVPGPPIDEPAVRTPYELADGRSVGRSDAPVLLDLWSDYQCPACDAFAGSVMPELVERYIRDGKVRLAIHDMVTIGNESLGAAISARCAERQGKYWEYHDLLFANQAPENSGAFTKERSRQFAAALGLDLEEFGTCLEDTTVEDAVNAESVQGLNQGVKETPTLYVNGEVVRPANNWSAIAASVDSALAGR